jgi:nickel-dependent lactate racemase
MILKLAYGRGFLDVEFPDDRTTIIKPADQAGLPDELAAVTHALDKPIGCAPLRELIKPTDRLCILFTDITRATPNERLIPWLLDYLKDHPRENITLLNQLGTHRPNTRLELEEMLTPEVVRDYHVINHEPENESALVQLGTTRSGAPALINRHAVEADWRIVTGFIEPHFFAGFSGGPKGIMPGVAGLKTVMSNHGHSNIGDPRATFGRTEGNPLWEELRDIALRTGPKFLVNVTLNEHREITGVFAGDLLQAHEHGREFVRKSAMQKVDAPFDIVVTTNSGYPLDQNLYQGVKGMSSGARVVKDGGLLILACECSDGVPNGSPYDRLLRDSSSPEELLTRIATPGFVRPEQWQSQIQSLIQRRARVLVKSALPDEVLRACHLTPCADIATAVRDELNCLPSTARVAVLPQGPLTVPYLK